MFQSSEKKEIYYKTDDEIELIRESCMLVSKTLAYVGSLIKPGVKTSFLDAEAEKFIFDNKGIPAFKGYAGTHGDFPFTLCVSVNEEVVHGFPNDREIQETDVISVDCGTLLNGYFGDSAYTFALGGVSEKVMHLLHVTNTSLYKGIEQAQAGKRIGDIGFAIFDYCERKNKYGVVRDLIGHGLGKSLHEDPDVPNHGKKGNGVLLRHGLVIAIEPMINMGTKDVVGNGDGWTILSADKKPSAHYEHTIAIRKGQKADILSTHAFIEAEVKKNPNLLEISILS
jgi:methionyl aminopeptidase